MQTKVCHISSVHSIDDTRIFQKECISLARKGFDVTIIAFGKTMSKDIENGVKRISLLLPSKNRFHRFRKRPMAIYKESLKLNADIYHFHDPELIPIGLKLKKKNKIVIYDVHEDYPLNILTKSWLPFFTRRAFSILMAYYEKHTLNKFDAIISVTPQIIKRLKKINKNTYLITNFPSFDKNLNLIPEIKERNSFCYAGAISPLRMLHKIIKALEHIPEAKFYLAGEINKYLESLKTQPGWKNVIYLGRIPSSEVQRVYARCSFGIVLEDYHPVNYNNEGSLGVTKLFEFMNSGLPIICSDFVIHKEIVDFYKCGITVNPNNINELITAINYLIKNPDIAIQMGENGQKAVIDKYNWSTQENVLLNLYSNLAEKQ